MNLKVIKVAGLTYVPKNFTGIVEYPNGDKEYLVNGKLHRENGPAVECPDGRKEYRINGKLHRIDGPAIESSNGSKAYYINNEQITREAQELLYFFIKVKGLL